MLIGAVLLFSRTTYAVDPGLDWRVLETENFFVSFADGHESIAQRAAVIAENAHRRLSQELNWTPEQKTWLVLSDETDFANGFATPLFFNRSVLFLAPPSPASSLGDFDDWLTTLITHEYTHILHLDKVRQAPSGLRNVFGRFFLLFPNLFEPLWITEGLATDKETDTKREIGRGQNSFFAMMMRMEVHDGIKPVTQVNLPINTWPAGTTRYLYGVYFMIFIAETRGDEKFQQFVEAYSGNLLPFSINSTFRKVFGLDVTAMWSEYEAWLQQRFSSQIDGIIATGLKQGEAVTDSGYRTGPVRAQGDRVYYIRNSGSHQPELVRRDSNKTEVLAEVHERSEFDVHETGGVLLAQLEYCNEFTVYSDLYVLDESSGDIERITECGRYLSAAWYPDGEHILAAHHEAGHYELHRLNSKGEQEEVLWRFGDGEILSDLDVSTDSRTVVASVWRAQTGWNLEFFDLENRQWRAITHDSRIQSQPQFSADGKSVYYSDDHDDIFNIYRYDIAANKHHQITNVLGGAFQPSQGAVNGPLYYISYASQGQNVYRLDDIDHYRQIRTTSNEQLKPYDYELKDYDTREYSPWPSLGPRWWFPVLALTDERSEFGVTTAGHDALSIHLYTLTAAYDSKNDLPLGSVSYRYSNLLTLGAQRSNDIFLDPMGNFNRVRSSDELFAVLSFPHTYQLWASNFLFGVVTDQSQDETLAPGAAPALDFEDNIVGGAWLYNSSKHYPLSISASGGRRITLVAEDSDTIESDFNGQVYTLRWREYLALGGEHVLALRAVYGHGNEQPAPFRLGGENTSLSYNVFLEQSGEPVFNRREYPLRGYDEGLPQLIGRRAQLYSAEWRFPIERVERGWMAPPLGLMQYSGSVFIDTGAAYQNNPPQRFFTGAGVELNADLNLFYFVPVRARLGVAHGFDAIGDDRIYLELGSSF